MEDKFIRSIDKSDDKQLISRIRASVNAWANETPHHPYPDLGDQIQIKSVTYFPSYPVRIKTQTEHRYVKEMEVPYRNQAVPPLKYIKPSDVDAWELNLGDITVFTDSCDTFSISGSQRVVTCARCSGDGKITCSSCSGRGKRSCSSCSGRGKTRCSSCNGTGGTVTKTTYSDGTTKTNTNRCGSCGGAGERRCNYCYGTGQVTCSTCNGSGKVTCPRCQGQGRLLLYLGCVRPLEVHQTTVAVLSGDILSQVPEYHDQMFDLPAATMMDVMADMLEYDVFPDNFMHANVVERIDISRKQAAGKRTLFQNLWVGRIETWQMEYTFNGKEYFMVLSGKNLAVYTSKSPIADVALEIWKKAYKAYKSNAFYVAYKGFAKLVHMGLYDFKASVDKSYRATVNRTMAQTRMGAWMGAVIATIFIAFFAAHYYTEVNYVFGYMGFLNSGGFMSETHQWSMVLFTVVMCLYSAKWSSELTYEYSELPSHTLRVVVGMVTGAVISVAMAAAIALVNVTGVTLLVALAGWVLKILLYVVGVAIALVVELVKWIIGLF